VNSLFGFRAQAVEAGPKGRWAEVIMEPGKSGGDSSAGLRD